MLFRTETVMALLLLGFRPVIADIDTVWLHDPVSIVKRGNLIYPRHASSHSTETEASSHSTETEASSHSTVAGARSFESVDLSVTNDNGEICGCFVAVNNTPRAR